MSKLRAGHRQRAVMEIEAEHVFDRMIELAEGAHEIGERDIAIAGGELRLCNGRIDSNRLIVGEILDEADDFTDRLARRMPSQDQVAPRIGAGLQEGITGLSPFGLPQTGKA